GLGGGGFLKDYVRVVAGTDDGGTMWGLLLGQMTAVSRRLESSM
ncbi:hypothetical protein Tco_0620520, partial [Tanacetum coccineum]